MHGPEEFFQGGRYSTVTAVCAFDAFLRDMHECWNEGCTRAGLVRDRPPAEASDILFPQAMQLISSMRHCIDGGFLLGAATLTRPICERLGLITFLHQNPSRVMDWWDNWPVRSQPLFGDLVASLRSALPEHSARPIKSTMNDLVHANADSWVFGASAFEAETLTAHPHSILNRPDLARVLALGGASFAIQIIGLLANGLGAESFKEPAAIRFEACLARFDEALGEFGTESH